MGFDSEIEVPVINLSGISPQSHRGSQEWQNLCKQVKEACENLGLFEVVYDKINMELLAQTFSVIKEVFELPVEIKRKNDNPKSYHGYIGKSGFMPLFESLGIEDVSKDDSITTFARLMWPDGHPQFCQAISNMMKPVDEVHKIIEMMIVDSYGLGEKMDTVCESKTLLKIMKYTAPPNGECMNGIVPHTDKPMSTLLFEDQISGLEVETKDGKWVNLSFPSPDSVYFMVGDPLMAWSNGRMHAVNHKVTMKGDENRYSFGTFRVPVEGTIIKPPNCFIDENHPRILEDFEFMDFLNFSNSKEGIVLDSAKKIFAFAGKQIKN